MSKKRETEVLVVGAGPVGLFTALNLAQRGLDVRIIDKEWRGSTHSYALALHPRTLRLLDEHGAADELLEAGHRVEKISLYEGHEKVGEMDYSALGGPFAFLLVVPQSKLEQALERQLSRKKIKVLWNHQALGLEQTEQTGQTVTTKVGRMEKYSMGYPVAHSEWMIAKELEFHSRFVVGADGYHSFVRRALGIEFEQVGTVEAFSVFEFPLRVESPCEARLVFHDGTANILWPMGRDRGRWSFQVDEDSSGPPVGLADLIRARAPWFRHSVDEIHWSTRVFFEGRLVKRFGHGRIWLAGDAAHMTGPVGVQSMNVGLREGHDLAELMSSIHKGGESIDLMERYETRRRAEWRVLLGLEDAPRMLANAPGRTPEQAARIVRCIPATGDNLERLLGQIASSWRAR